MEDDLLTTQLKPLAVVCVAQGTHGPGQHVYGEVTDTVGRCKPGMRNRL